MRVRNQADVDEGGHEARRVGSDPDVAGTGERESRSSRSSVHRRDHGLFERPDRANVGVVEATEPLGDVAGCFPELGQVLADAEATARACYDDGPDFVSAGLLQCGPEPVVHGVVEGVQDVRPVERDREDGTLARCLHLGHRRRP